MNTGTQPMFLHTWIIFVTVKQYLVQNGLDRPTEYSSWIFAVNDSQKPLTMYFPENCETSPAYLRILKYTLWYATLGRSLEEPTFRETSPAFIRCQGLPVYDLFEGAKPTSCFTQLCSEPETGLGSKPETGQWTGNLKTWTHFMCY